MNTILQLAPFPVPADYAPHPDPGPVLQAPADLSPGWLARHGANTEIILTHSMRGIAAEEITALPALRLIACFGVGLDRIALDAAKAQNVTVAYTPGVLTDDVADLALALILAGLRRVVQGDHFVRAGRWGTTPFPLGRSAKGRKLGVFGFGRIGQAIAARASPFGFEIGYCSRSEALTNAQRFPHVIDLARWCDVLVVAAAATPETQGSISADVIEALGTSGYLVNIARGSMIDEGALAVALERGAIAGAALDVFAQEPLPADHRLLASNRTALTPHIGSATHDTRVAMANMVYDDVAAFRRGAALKGTFAQI